MKMTQYVTDVKITLNENTLTFRSEKLYFIPLNLPFELNCIVLTYLYELSITKFTRRIPRSYPYTPTIWSIEASSINVPSDYKRAVMFQNSRYNSSWSDRITLEKDIQNMIDATNIIYDSSKPPKPNQYYYYSKLLTFRPNVYG